MTARHAIYEAFSPGPGQRVSGWAGFIEQPGVGCKCIGWKPTSEQVRDEIVGIMWDAGIRRSFSDDGDEINAERSIA